MKKLLLFITASILFIHTQAQNSLVNATQTGDPVGSTSIDDFDFAYDAGTGDLVLVVATGSNSMLHFIDMNGLSATGVTDLMTDTIPGVLGDIASSLGTTSGNVYIWNMENNPKTRSTFILASNGFSGTRVLFEAKSQSSVQAVSFTNSSYCSTQFSSSKPINDIAWGNDTLYFTVGSFSLAGELGVLAAPFSQNQSVSSRSTSMHKSNWGGGYFTTAPLERITYGVVNGEHRLMGVTTCAPGFSIKTSDAVGGTTLQVVEEFNVNYSQMKKTFSVTKGHYSFLFNYHSGNQTQRIGERFIDGVTPQANNETNNSAKLLRDNMGNEASGLQPHEFKIINRTDLMVCKYNDDYTLRLTSGGTLKVRAIEWSLVSGVADQNTLVKNFITPNPVADLIQLPKDLVEECTMAVVTTMEGKEVLRETLQGNTLDVAHIPAGNYILSLKSGAKILATDKFIKL